MVEMYLQYRDSYKRIPHPGGEIWNPVYDWYEITDTSPIYENFTIGKCIRIGRTTSNVWVLYHTGTMQAICIGTKGAMRKLAKEMKSYSFDGVATWKQGSSTIRSLTKLKETKQ
jgi:hypothetical protein